MLKVELQIEGARTVIWVTRDREAPPAVAEAWFDAVLYGRMKRLKGTVAWAWGGGEAFVTVRTEDVAEVLGLVMPTEEAWDRTGALDVWRAGWCTTQ